MNYVKDFIQAFNIYSELKNIQIGTNLNTLIKTLEELQNYQDKSFNPSDLENIFNNYMKPYDICYGNLEMLRALRILSRSSDKKAIYKVTALGRYILKESEISSVIILLKLFNNLNSIKILKQFIKDKGNISPEEISKELGEEMVYYNKLLLNKEWKKPFNIPITRTLLNILFELKVLQKDPVSKRFFM